MGMGNLDPYSKTVLVESARMAYSRDRGQSGGRGRMGILKDADGNFRVIKFNTHLKERWGGPSATEEMVQSSNELRARLLGIAAAAGLGQDQIRAIRKKLGLPRDGTGTESSKLLDRSVVATVVTMIGGQEVWRAAGQGVDMASYRSEADMHFSVVKDRFAKITSSSGKTLPDRRVAALETVYADASAKIEAICTQKDFPEGLVERLKGIVTLEFVEELAYGGLCTGGDVDAFVESLAKFIRDLAQTCPEITAANVSNDTLEAAMPFLREGCRRAMAGSLADYGLDARQISRLRSAELTPIDVMPLVQVKFPELKGDNLLKVAKAVSICAAVDLGACPDNDVQKTVAEIKKGIQEGKYRGLAGSVLLLGRNDKDLERYLRAQVDGKTDGLEKGLQKLGSASALLECYRAMKPILFKDVPDDQAWNEFRDWALKDNFELLTLDHDRSSELFDALRKNVLNIVLTLDPADVSKLRKQNISPFEVVDILGKRKSTDSAANCHLLAHFAETGVQLGRDVLLKKIDDFWEAVGQTMEKSEAGWNKDADGSLTDAVWNRLFQMIAVRHPNAANDKLEVARIKDDCKHVVEVFQEMAKHTGKHKASEFVKSYAVSSTAVCELRTALWDFAKLQELSVEWKDKWTAYKEFMEKADAYMKRLGACKLLITDNADMQLVNSLFSFNADPVDPLERVVSLSNSKSFLSNYVTNHDGLKDIEKMSERLKVCDDLLDRYYPKLKALESDPGTVNSKEKRALLLANAVMVSCLANTSIKMSSKGSVNMTVFGRLYAACLKEGGILDQIDLFKNGNKSRASVAEFLSKVGRLVYEACWNPGDQEIRNAVYGVTQAEAVGWDEKGDGMQASLLPLLCADPDVSAAIIQTLGDPPELSDDEQQAAGLNKGMEVTLHVQNALCMLKKSARIWGLGQLFRCDKDTNPDLYRQRIRTSLLNYGLTEKQVEQLEKEKLLPTDVMSSVKAKFGWLKDDDLLSVSLAVSVCAAADLKEAAGDEVQNTLSRIKKGIQEGSYSGLACGMLLAGRNDDDLDRYLRARVDGNMDGLEKGLQNLAAAPALMEGFNEIREFLFEGVSDDQAWDEFRNWALKGDFGLLAMGKNKDDLIAYLRRNLLTVARELVPADVSALREQNISPFEVVKILLACNVKDHAANGRLLAYFARTEAPVSSDVLIKKVNDFWTSFDPDAMMSEAGWNDAADGQLTTEERARLFRLIAVRRPEVASDKTAIDKIKGDCKRVVEVFREMAKHTGKHKASEFVSCYVSAVRLRRELRNALLAPDFSGLTGFSKTLKDKWNVYRKFMEKADAFVADLEKRKLLDIRNGAPERMNALFGFGNEFLGNSSSLSDNPNLLSDYLTNSNGVKKIEKMAAKLQQREADLETYCNQLKILESDPGTVNSKEKRAQLLATTVMVACLANVDVNLFSAKDAAAKVYDRLYAACSKENGILDLFDRFKQGDKDRASVAQFLAQVGRLVYQACWNPHDAEILADVYGGDRNITGANTTNPGMLESFLALLRADSGVPADIRSALGNQPDLSDDEQRAAGLVMQGGPENSCVCQTVASVLEILKKGGL